VGEKRELTVDVKTGFSKTHNLILLTELPEGWRVKTMSREAASLSSWAVEPRYPGDSPEATVETARNVYGATLEDLERHGYTPPDEG
jgi:hypothetical protein